MTTTKSKRQRVKDGDILAIKIGHELYAFGRVIDGAIAVYNYTSEDMNKLPDIEDRYFLFIVTVYVDVLSSGEWPRVGRDNLKLSLPRYFKRDQISGKYSIYDCNEEKEYPATRDDCIGMEKLAVWHKEIVEERIRDSLKGVRSRTLGECEWVPVHIKYDEQGRLESSKYE